MQKIFKWPEFLEEFEAVAVECGFAPEVILETGDGPMMGWTRGGENTGKADLPFLGHPRR